MGKEPGLLVFPAAVVTLAGSGDRNGTLNDGSHVMKRFSLTAAVLGLVVSTGTAVRAGESPDLAELEARIGRSPTISDLVAYAYETNPEIRAARAGWRAVVEQYRVATAYPDPQLMVTYFPKPIETRLGPQDWNATLSQGIPFPGKLSKAGDLVQADARIARLELDKAVREVVVNIRESYHELLYIRQAKQAVKQNGELLDHLRKLAETSYAQDRAAFVDVVKAQSQSAQLQYDSILLEELEETEIARLNALLNRPPAEGIGPVQPVTLPSLAYGLDEIYRLAEANQEEIRMAETRLEKAVDKVALARYQNLPDFRVGVFYAGIGDPDVAVPPKDAGRDAVGLQAGVSIPLWAGRNKSRVAGARAEVERARSMKAMRVNETHAQIRSLFFRLRNAERLVHLYRDNLLPQAAQAVEVSETWFQQGEGSFSDFVETQAVWYNFQLSLARAQADYGRFLARLERLAGRSLTEKEEEKPTSGEEPG
ncbi:MAG: TolC family protein [Deferrisomatales bacterium]